LKIYLSLFGTEEFSQNLFKNLNEKLRINCTEADITKNLGFYENLEKFNSA
jgi:hypothetical protein